MTFHQFSNHYKTKKSPPVIHHLISRKNLVAAADYSLPLLPCHAHRDDDVCLLMAGAQLRSKFEFFSRLITHRSIAVPSDVLLDPFLTGNEKILN